MKYFWMAVILAAAGFLTWRQRSPKPVPAPPPAPPAALKEPAPIISEAEQAKVIRAAKDQDPDVRW